MLDVLGKGPRLFRKLYFELDPYVAKKKEKEKRNHSFLIGDSFWLPALSHMILFLMCCGVESNVGTKTLG